MCAFEGVGFCSSGKADCNCFLRVLFFFFKFRVGVGKTGLSGLSPSALVSEQLGGWGGGGVLQLL